jgi:Uma2 family endonuclease
MAIATARRLLTVEEFLRMCEAGILKPDERLELAHGEIIEMAPIGARHHACVIQLTRFLGRLGDEAIVSIQGPLALDAHTLRYPDVALLRKRGDQYVTAVPSATDALLVIEVGDTTVASDREEKIPQYAAAGIPEAWLIDLPANLIEIYLRPEGSRYTQCSVVAIEGSVSPAAFPAFAFSLAALRA